MKIKLLKVQNWLILSLIALLGLGACDSSQSLSHLNVRGGGVINRDELRRVPQDMDMASSSSSASFGEGMTDEEAAIKAASDAAAQAMLEEEDGGSARKHKAGKNRRSKKSNQRGELQRQNGESATDEEVKDVDVEESIDIVEEEMIEEEEEEKVFEELTDEADMNMMVYVVKGKVVNSAGKPIPGMQLALLGNSVDATPYNFSAEGLQEGMVAVSAEDGTFTVKTTEVRSDYIRLFVRDIDGPSKGNYKNDVINVYFGKEDVSDTGHGWRYGTSEKSIIVRPKLNR